MTFLRQCMTISLTTAMARLPAAVVCVVAVTLASPLAEARNKPDMPRAMQSLPGNLVIHWSPSDSSSNCKTTLQWRVDGGTWQPGDEVTKPSEYSKYKFVTPAGAVNSISVSDGTIARGDADFHRFKNRTESYLIYPDGTDRQGMKNGEKQTPRKSIHASKLKPGASYNFRIKHIAGDCPGESKNIWSDWTDAVRFKAKH